MAPVVVFGPAESAGAAGNVVPLVDEMAAHNIASLSQWILADSRLKGCRGYKLALGQYSMPEWN